MQLIQYSIKFLQLFNFIIPIFLHIFILQTWYLLKQHDKQKMMMDTFCQHMKNSDNFSVYLHGVQQNWGHFVSGYCQAQT